jgi:hypothetical protein
MNWIPWYLSDQYWAEPNLAQFAEKMRWYYMSWKDGGLPFKEEIKEYAKFIKNVYSKESIIETLLLQLEEI